jgi:hypothetical protein
VPSGEHGRVASPNKIAEAPLTELAAEEAAGLDTVAERARMLRMFSSL